MRVEHRATRLCRAAHEIQHPHGEYVGRAEPCVHAQSPARHQPSVLIAGLVMRICLVAAWLMCGLLSASAQLMPDVPTDQELAAAYCLGALRHQASELVGTLGSEGAPDLDRELKDWFAAKTSRLQHYLTVRGYMLGSRSSTALTAVVLETKRGQRDAFQCLANSGRCPSKCSLSVKCIEGCIGQQPACVSFRRCGDEKWPPLPF